MKHILEMLMEIENLTPAEKALVQENIANLDPQPPGASVQSALLGHHQAEGYGVEVQPCHLNHLLPHMQDL